MRTLLSLSLPACLLSLSAVASAQGPEKPAEPGSELLKTSPDGLKSERVAERAVATSYNAKASEAALQAAAARVDAAWANFFPRVSGLVRYTRLSELTLPAFGAAGGVNFVGTMQPGGTPNPTPTFSIDGSVFAFRFPVFFNSMTIQGTIVVPISDYFLRITQSYSAATLSREAARYDVAAARAKAGSDGKIAYYTWLRARGEQVVAEQTLEDAKTHATDTKNVFTVGRASKADVLRAETAVANAELGVEMTKNLVNITEKQIRIAMHDEGDAPYVPGESLDTPLPPFQGNLKQLTDEAISARMEIRSIDANAQAAHKNAVVTRNGAFPQISGVGNVTVQNPNQRLIPQRDEFFPTWDLSLQLTWSPNDILLLGNQAAAIDAQAEQLVAQKQALRDGISLEVAQAYNAVKESEFASDTARREVASAREAYRVARELFVAGSATATVVADAETELARARRSILNAHANLRIAHVRLEHAVGRDAKLAE